MNPDVRNLVLLVAALLLAVTVATGAYVGTFAHSCRSRGGTFTINGGTAWCRW